MNNLDLSPVLKRVGAYMIDILITLIIATLITSLPFLNTRYQKYQKVYNEYQEVYNDYTDTLILLDDSFKDKNITKEEYDKLSASKMYSDLFESLYEDEVIDEDEYNEAKKEIDKIYTDTATDYNYRLQKLGIYNSIITIATTFIYFGIIQFFLKGQTVGKKLLHLQVVPANDKKLTILNYILRCLIINNVLLNSINLLFLSFTNQTIFTKCDSIISLLVSIIEAITIYLVIVRKDHRGLHDLICNTKVITTKEPKKD